MRGQILKFWYIIEFLNQTDFPYFKERSIDKHYSTAAIKHNFDDIKKVYSLIEKDDSIIKHLPLKADAINICLGKISRNQCVNAIYKLMRTEDKRAESTKGFIAFIGLKVSTLKRYIAHSFNISPIIWTIYKMKEANSTNLSSLINQKEYEQDLEDIESWLMDQDDITEDILNKLYEKVKKKFIASDVSIDVTDLGFLTYQRYRDENAKEQNEEQLNDANLNMTFFTQDLDTIIEMNKKDILSLTKYGRTFVEPYITCRCNDTNRQKTDLLVNSKESKEAFKEILHIDNTPYGKWPSRYAPVLMQQVAINMAVSNNEKFPSCVAVNGPPGTGKTTMLKEIIADAIVKKAMQMVKYDESDNAFTKCNYRDGNNRDNGYNYYYPHYYKVNDDISQYSILVASNNNAAVENITKELPDGEALCDNLEGKEMEDENEINLMLLHDLFDKKEEDIYYTECANKLFNARDMEQSDYYWGLISAPLGNRKNQGKVIDILQMISREICNNQAIETHKKDYKKAQDQFNEQLKKVKQERERLIKACNANCDLNSYIDSINKLNKSCEHKIKKIDKEKAIINIKIQEAKNEKDKLNNQLTNKNDEITLESAKVAEYEGTASAQKDLVNEIEKEIIEWESQRTFLDVLSAFLRIKTLKNTKISSLYEKKQANEEEAENAKRVFESEEKILASMEHDLNTINSDIDKQKKIISNCKNELENLNHQQEELKLEIEKNDQNICIAKDKYNNWLKGCEKKKDYQSYDILDDTFFHSLYGDDSDACLKAHLMNPWMSEKYNREREKLFFYALKVNKEFILSSKMARSNLQNLLMMWTGTDGENTVKFSATDKDAAFPALLQTLSMIIPVISTTFASVNRFLNHVKVPFQLGTLIIDEAGQAQPYTALGALVRCRKAIVVGDPKQVEPVVKDDLDAIKQLLGNKYTRPYLDKRLSIQQFADELNPYGTYFKSGNGEQMWVGCPLVVHRRCIHPMFDISNTISYSGIMKSQTKEPDIKKKESFALPFSQWVQCVGKENNHNEKDHFVKEQGQTALKIIEQAVLNAEDKIPNLFVISPFNSVVNGMKSFIKKSDLYQQFDLENWLNENIGTVHTFQGKEADEVILLLGCDQDAESAIKWVNSNIINVAVTRAKYRLCVIGDYQAWKKNKHVRTVKSIIDAYTLKELERIKDEEPTDDTKKHAKLLLQRVPSFNDYIDQTEDDVDNQINTYELMKALKIVRVDTARLTNEEMEKYHITDKDLKELSYQARSHLIAGIKINAIFNTLLSVYDFEFQDRSFKNIMFCKATEVNVRDSFIEGLKKHFPEDKLKGKTLKEAKESLFMLGATAHLLNDKKTELASILNDREYDEQWWGSFIGRLKAMGQLRNKCCHTGEFSLDQEKEMIKLLFEERVFKDIKIGKRIKNAKRLAVHN